MNRIPLLLSILFFLIYRAVSYLTGEVWLSLLVFTLPVGLVFLNFILRKSLRFKTWFLSPANILLERKSYNLKSEIDVDLLFDKLLEVVKASDFRLIDVDKNSKQILCGTSLNFWTWGENVYIRLEEEQDGNTLIHFNSVTLFGNTSWHRNQKNYDSFIASFEASLTI